MVSLSMVFTLGGTTFTVSKTTDYRLMGYSGLEASDYENDIADNAVGDGSYYQSSRVVARSISVSFMVVDASKTASGRTAIMSFFKPKLLGSLAVTRGAITRKIGFCLSGIEFINPDSSVPKLRVTINLICPDPYFYATTPTVVAAVGRVATINNPGDVECGFVCTITAAEAIPGPYVEKYPTPDGRIEMDLTMANTDVLIISTVPGSKYVTFEGSISYDYLVTSTFFYLDVGSNVIIVYTAAAPANASASYSFVPRYLGV